MRTLLQPDRASMEIAHSLLRVSTPLDQMLQSRSLSLILTNVARRHMQRRQQLDAKKLQANDND